MELGNCALSQSVSLIYAWINYYNKSRRRRRRRRQTKNMEHLVRDGSNIYMYFRHERVMHVQLCGTVSHKNIANHTIFTRNITTQHKMLLPLPLLLLPSKTELSCPFFSFIRTWIFRLNAVWPNTLIQHTFLHIAHDTRHTVQCTHWQLQSAYRSQNQ